MEQENTRMQPTKPYHFFKPILSESSFTQLSIPRGFFKYLDGEKCEGEAILRSNRSSNGKSWRVKVNGFRFQEGWSDFVRDHNLHVMDLLVFRHEGGMVFNVKLFDVSACEREYPPLDSTVNDQTAKIEEERESKKQCKKNFGSSIFAPKVMRFEEPNSYPSKHPQFTTTVKSYHLKESVMLIPKKFVRATNLEDKCCIMTLKDQNGRSWEVVSRKKADGRVYIRGGWHDFSDANNLKKGDLCTFKLISTRLKPVMEVSISHYGTK